MKTLAINLQNTETWPHLCLHLVKQIRSSTWENNARRGKRDPWTYSSQRMRCLIKPTSIWACRADRRGEHRGLRSVESRPTCSRRAGSRSQYSSALRGGRGTSWEAACLLSKGSGWGTGCHGLRPTALLLVWHTGSGGWPSLSLLSSRGPSAFIDPGQGIGCGGGCFMMMIILKTYLLACNIHTKREIVSA